MSKDTRCETALGLRTGKMVTLPQHGCTGVNCWCWTVGNDPKVVAKWAKAGEEAATKAAAEYAARNA